MNVCTEPRENHSHPSENHWHPKGHLFWTSQEINEIPRGNPFGFSENFMNIYLSIELCENQQNPYESNWNSKGYPFEFHKKLRNPNGPLSPLPPWFLEEFFEYLQLNCVKFTNIYMKTIKILRGTPFEFWKKLMKS